MKIKTNTFVRIYIAAVCFALLPLAAFAEDEVVVRGGSNNVRQKFIHAPQAGSMDDLNRGLAKYDSGDLKGALVDMNKAILRDPQNTQAYFYRGLVRESLGDYFNAVSDFEQNRVAAFDSIVLSEKSACLINMYELPAALVSVNKSLAQDHSSTDAATAYSRRAIVKRLMHNPADALVDCNQAIMLMPNSVDAKWQRAVTNLLLHKVSDAVPDLQFVVHTSPAFANGHYTLAECFRVMGRWDDALDEYKKSLTLFSAQNDVRGTQAAQARVNELTRTKKS